MGRPGIPEEKLSGTQLLGAPAVPHPGHRAVDPAAQDSDLVLSITLAVALVLLFLLLSSWLCGPDVTQAAAADLVPGWDWGCPEDAERILTTL